MPKEDAEIEVDTTSQEELNKDLVLSENGDVILKNTNLTDILHEKVGTGLGNPDVNAIKVGVSVDF